MTKEQAIERLKIKLDNDKKYLEQCNPFSDLVNEVRLDNKSIEIVLSMLEEKDKIISLMLEKFADIDFDDMCLDCECCVGNGCIKEERDLYENCIKQYFENKAKELINK